MELADDSVELTVESDVDEKSESVELSGFNGDFEDSEDDKPRVGVWVRPPRSNGLSTIDEETHVPSSTGRSFSVNSSMVSRLNRNSTASAIVCARDLETICEEQKSLISQFSSSYVSNRQTEHTKPNHSRFSASSSAMFSRSHIRNRLEALKPVEHLDYSTIMNSLNIRSIFFKQRQQAILSEQAIVSSEKAFNRKLQMSGKSAVSSKTKDLPSRTNDDNKRDVENSLQIRPSVLAFGFVDVKKTHCIQLTIRNSSDRSICFEPSILSDEKENVVFEVKSLSSITVEANNTFYLDVHFTPKSYGSFNAQLRLTTIGLDMKVHRIGMFGFGARAQLLFCQYASQRTEPIEFGTDGMGVCWIDRNQTRARLVLRNNSQRSAFVYLYLTDGLNQPIVDLKFPHGMNALLHETRSVSRLSTVSGQLTRTVANEQLVRLHVYWGEERQRQRLKIFFQENENERRTFHGIDFTTTEFSGENGDLAAKLTGIYDVQLFVQGLRRTTIQFYDNHVCLAPSLDGRRALLESDGTFAQTVQTFCDHSRVNAIEADETLLRAPTMGGRRVYY